MHQVERPLEGDKEPTGGFSFGERTTRAIEGFVNKVGDRGGSLVEKIDNEIVTRGPQVDAIVEVLPRSIETSIDTFTDRAERYIQTRRAELSTTVDEVLDNPSAMAKLSNFMSVSFLEAQDLSGKMAVGLAAMPTPVQEQVRVILLESPLAVPGLIAAAFGFYLASKLISDYNTGEMSSVPIGEPNALNAESAAELIELFNELKKAS